MFVGREYDNSRAICRGSLRWSGLKSSHVCTGNCTVYQAAVGGVSIWKYWDYGGILWPKGYNQIEYPCWQHISCRPG